MSDIGTFPRAAVRRLFKIVNGGTPDSQNQDYWDGDIPWVTPEDLSGLARPAIGESKRTITKEGYNSCGTTLVPSGSIVLSTRAPIGNLAIAERSLCTNQGCRSLVPLLDLSSRYFCYQLSVLTAELNRLGRGTTFLELSSQELASLKVFAPPKQLQERIANLLDEKTARIDALIAEKERLIRALQELTHSRLAHEMTGGEHASTPTPYEWYQRIPPTWTVVPFKVAVRFVEGPGILAQDFRDNGVPLLRISCVRSDIATLEGCDYLDPAMVETTWKHFRVRRGDLLISASASMGTVALVTEQAEGAVPYTGIIILRPDERVVTRDFVRNFVVSEQFIRQIDNMKTGTAIQHFGPTHLSQVVMAVPKSLGEQTAVARRLEEWRGKQTALTAHAAIHIDSLREYRSSLIAAAVTGNYGKLEQ